MLSKAFGPSPRGFSGHPVRKRPPSGQDLIAWKPESTGSTSPVTPREISESALRSLGDLGGDSRHKSQVTRHLASQRTPQVRSSSGGRCSMATKMKRGRRTRAPAVARRRRAVSVGKNAVYVLRQDLGVSQELMARLLGISLRTLSRLEGSIEPPKPPRAFAELSRLTEGLLSIIRRESLASWIDRPNEAFGGLKPIEVIERGEVDRIWKMIHHVGVGEPL